MRARPAHGAAGGRACPAGPVRRITGRNAFVEVQLGMALSAANKPLQAISELQRGLLAGGVYDHPLTSLALLELGQIAFDQEKYDVAQTYFHGSDVLSGLVRSL